MHRQQGNSEPPRKAYALEVVSRAVKTVIVYADSYADARERYESGEGEGYDVQYDAKGIASIRRERSSDR